MQESPLNIARRSGDSLRISKKHMWHAVCSIGDHVDHNKHCESIAHKEITMNRHSMNDEKSGKNRDKDVQKSMVDSDSPIVANAGGEERFNGMEIKPGLKVLARVQTFGDDKATKYVATVDHMDGDEYVKLDKKHFPDGRHRWIPLDWIDKVDDKSVCLNISQRDFEAKALKYLPAETQKKAS